MEEMEEGTCFATVGTDGATTTPTVADAADSAGLESDDGVFSWA